MSDDKYERVSLLKKWLQIGFSEQNGRSYFVFYLFPTSSFSMCPFFSPSPCPPLLYAPT